VYDWNRVREWLRRVGPLGMTGYTRAQGAVRQGRKRLLAMLFLFDALLIAATLLSFQSAELVEQEQTIQETRAVYEVLYHEQVVNVTTVITQVVPYGSIP
jgi:hypothetical protein